MEIELKKLNLKNQQKNRITITFLSKNMTNLKDYQVKQLDNIL
jgi:hypothetical protein